MANYLFAGGNLKSRDKKIKEVTAEIMGDNKNEHDFKTVDILEGKKLISIEQARDANSFVFLRPEKANKKIVWIRESQNLSVEAQNSLLKTLEEPPEYAVFLITVNNAKNVLSTLLSRCIVISLGGENRIDIESSANSEYVALLCNMLFQDVGKRLDWIVKNKDIVKDRNTFESITDAILSSFRDLLVINVFYDSQVLNGENEIKNYIINIYNFNDLLGSYKRISDKNFEKNLLELIKKIQDLQYKVKNNNVSPTLVLEYIFQLIPFYS